MTGGVLLGVATFLGPVCHLWTQFGVHGFLGSHVATQLLERGYLVRGVTRTAEVMPHVLSLQQSHPSSLELVQADLLADGEGGITPQHCEGVDAVVHTAVPARSADVAVAEQQVRSTLAVLRAAAATPGPKKRVVITSSFAALTESFEPGRTYVCRRPLPAAA